MEVFIMSKLKFMKNALLLGGLVATVSLASTAFAHDSSIDKEAPRIVSVNVLNATTVQVAFNEAVANNTTTISERHFYVDHSNADTPHTHEVSAVKLSTDKKTVTLTFSRALHPDMSMPLYINKVADLSGNLLSDKETVKYETK
jgi:hypothetical protein